jgi:addiction module HigA family antidote
MKMHNPPHPGEVLNESWLKPIRISITEAASKMGITRKHLSNIANAKASITPDIAKRIEAITGSSAEMWLNMQSDFDLWQLRNNDYSDIPKVA